MRAPRAPGFDNTAAFLREGYDFVARRCASLGTDLFETRLMLRRAYCARGEDAARMFYTPGRFTRRGAMPPSALRLLQDKGSVQLLDGEAHRRRKALFLSILDEAGVARLVECFDAECRARSGTWALRERIVLHTEMERTLCRAACAWAGVPLAEADADARTESFSAMLEGSGALGPRLWRGLVHRSRIERWMRRIVREARSGRRPAQAGTALAAIAAAPFDPKVAAVELINLVRPTVAVARFITFAALALHEQPHWHAWFRAGDEHDLEPFAQEVRRFYPFFPVIGGRAAQSFDWRGHHFRKGAWVLLDLYGTNHDPSSWRAPGRFDPTRFRDGAREYSFVPQGAGSPERGHRCPGEPATVELVKQAVRFLTRAIDYAVPAQDLSIDASRMPAIPASRFVIAGVRPRPPSPRAAGAPGKSGRAT
jgi:fatty-acid peroxygenase